MSQYKEFAVIYDELINSDIDYNTWADKIMDICNKYNIEEADYLDLACGTGNLTLKIAKNFKRAWAVDLSEQMLTEAEGKLRSAGIKAKLICQDICSLKLNSKYDLITCCLDSTNYITEDEDIKLYFKGVYDHLKDNGLFIFDVNSYNKLTEVLGNNTFTFDNEEVVYIWENFLEDDIVSMNLTFFVKEENNYRRFDEEHSERAYKEEYLDKIIKETGFRVIEKLNNYESILIDKDCERLVYVLGKGENNVG